MQNRILLISLIVCGLFFISSCGMFGGDVDMEEGLYRITYKTEITGMPFPIPPFTLSQCLTKDNPVPDQSSKNQECKITNMQKSGDTVTWKMECTQRGGSMQASGTMTFKGDSLEGKTQMNMGPDAGNRVITTYMKGKRVGPCG
jgi:hypothetical protein